MNKYEEKQPDSDGMDYEFVEQYLTDLVSDINLRLFCEREADTDMLFPSGRIFWIEGVTLLSYEPGICSQKIARDVKISEVSRSLLRRIARWIKNRLTEIAGKGALPASLRKIDRKRKKGR